MTKPGPKPMVKPRWHPMDDLTEMQRRFVDHLVHNQGRTTLTKAALEAGYSPARATIEGSELMDNPKVVKYYRYKINEVNRSYTVTNSNYLLRQQKLSEALEKKGKEEKCGIFENLIGKASGQFVETHLHGDISELSKQEKMHEIRRLKRIQKETIDPVSAKKLITQKLNK